MATSSILKNVTIKGRKSSKAFADAIIKSRTAISKKRDTSFNYKEVDKSEIKGLFKINEQ